MSRFEGDKGELRPTFCLLRQSWTRVVAFSLQSWTKYLEQNREIQ